MPSRPRILFIGPRWPEPEATAAGKRLLQLIDFYLQMDGEVHFATVSRPGTYPADLTAMGVVTHSISLNNKSFDDFLKKFGFNTVVFDRFQTEEQFGWRVREQLPACQLILDTEDLHSLRESREKAIREEKEWTLRDWTSSPKFSRELASILRCDCSLMISRAEIALLHQVFPWIRQALLYIPFQMEPPEIRGQKAHGDRKNFIFIGNGKHAPNRDAISLLIKEIWPVLRGKCPGAELHIYGAYLPESLASAHDPDQGVRIMGYAPNLEEIMGNARLQLVPMRFGAGIKGKIVEGLRYGLPSLSTPIGSEGIYSDGAPSALEAVINDTFITKAASLYTRVDLWEESGKLAFQKAKEHFLGGIDYKEVLKETLEEKSEEGGSEAAVLRRILRDRAFDSARYMSKWIEEKAKHT